MIFLLFFYAWGEPVFVFVMMVLIVINWFIGRAIGSFDDIKKKSFFIIGIICDLGILGYYKYAGFMVSIINGVFDQEMLPVLQIIAGPIVKYREINK